MRIRKPVLLPKSSILGKVQKKVTVIITDGTTKIIALSIRINSAQNQSYTQKSHIFRSKSPNSKALINNIAIT